MAAWRPQSNSPPFFCDGLPKLIIQIRNQQKTAVTEITLGGQTVRVDAKHNVVAAAQVG